MESNETDLKVWEVKKCIGEHKLYKDGVKPIKFARVAECSILCETKANIDLMVQLKERLETS